jgi:YHS domain-containing protein
VRGLLLVVIVVFAVILVSRMLNVWRRGSVTAPVQHGKLVKDPVCNTYIVMSRAVTSEVGGTVTHFCSRECAARFARGERRR